MRKKGTTIFLLVVLCLTGSAQVPLGPQFHLDLDELNHHLSKAPLWEHDSSTENPTEVKLLLPTPTGQQQAFEVWLDPILSEELQATLPEYQTYHLQSDKPALSGRLMISPAGLDAVIISEKQVMFIEPVGITPSLHQAYYWKLGSSYLSFEYTASEASSAPRERLRMAVLSDAEYVSFHKGAVDRAVLASVNNMNAFLQMQQGIHVDLHYLSTVERQEIFDCRIQGFRGRTAESIKLFGDLIAAEKLGLGDFDLGFLFSGRGFGGSALRRVVGKNAYYDWNEDQIFDGPAKAGGGIGAVQPAGANWWGTLCKGINRQIGTADLAVNAEQSADGQEELTGHLSSVEGNLEHFPVTMKHYSGPGAIGEQDFPYLSCLPKQVDRRLSLLPTLGATIAKKAFPQIRLSLTSSALLPLYIGSADNEAATQSWLEGSR